MIKINLTEEIEKNYAIYFHATDYWDDKIFTEGLYNQRGTELQDVFYEYNPEFETFEDKVNTYFTDRRYLVLAIIPKRYLGCIDRDDNPYIPMPIWKTDKEESWRSERGATLIPELINMMIDRKTGSYIKNPNYSRYYDPEGLAYDETSIEFMKNYIPSMMTEAESRRDMSFDEIRTLDRKSNKFKGVKKIMEREKQLDDSKRLSPKDIAVKLREAMQSEAGRASKIKDFFERIFGEHEKS